MCFYSKYLCIFLFNKSGIRPAWEDPANEGGGRLVLRIPKGRTAYLWEELVLIFY